MAIPKTYDEFLDFAKDAARAIAPNAEISTQKVDKLQGESYVGLSVRPENSHAAVTMNLRGLFDQVQKNPKRLAAVMSEFLSALDQAIKNIPRIDPGRLLDYSQVKNLRKEARQKLEAVRPVSLGQASRISGVSPADVSQLMLFLRL